MGEWGTVTFVHTVRQRALERALTTVLRSFGFEYRGEGPSGADLEILVIPGSGWTAVKCSDGELLAKRPPRSKTAALGLLTKELGRSAFLMSIYDGDSIAMLEASARGKTVASGGEASHASPWLQEERIASERHLLARFYLLRVSEELREVTEESGLFAAEVSELLVPQVPSHLVYTNHGLNDEERIEGASWLSFGRPD